MRIFHTSDWHIGKRLYNKELVEEHRLFFDWLLDQINHYQIDILLVSGDIFDLAYPSNSSLALYYQTLTRIQSSCCKHIIITGGNHDSVSTLNAPKEILEYLNIHIVGGVEEELQENIIEIKNAADETELVVCAIPYLRDKDIRQSVAGESFDERVSAIRKGFVDFYGRLAREVEDYKSRNIPVIATGHLLLLGGMSSDSEREIYIGNLDQVRQSDIPDVFDYFALGHLHRPQMVAGKKHIRYSGSPVSLSFSERNEKKSLVLLETENGAISSVEIIEIPKFRKMLRVKGTFSEVVEKLMAIEADADSLTPLAEIEIVEENYNPLIISETIALAEKTEIPEIVNYKVMFTKNEKPTEEVFSSVSSLKEMKTEAVFEKLLEKENIAEKDEMIATFNELRNSMEQEAKM